MKKQRVSIARALAGQPAILLADEPTGALDQTSGREVLKLFRELNDMGNTIVMITHDLGVDVTAVNRRDYGQKIGTLAEISGFHKNGKIYNGPDFAMEMLVFSGMDSQQVDAFLAEYKATGLPPVALKAIVTPYNVSWTADALLRELLKEHIQLGG